MKKQSKDQQKNSRPRPTTRPDRPAEIAIEIALPSTKIADTIYSSLLPETKQRAGYRSETKVMKRGKTLELKIVADDLVALRAASNTFLRFVSVALKTLNAVAPFYRARSPA